MERPDIEVLNLTHKGTIPVSSKEVCWAVNETSNTRTK